MSWKTFAKMALIGIVITAICVGLSYATAGLGTLWFLSALKWMLPFFTGLAEVQGPLWGGLVLGGFISILLGVVHAARHAGRQEARSIMVQATTQGTQRNDSAIEQATPPDTSSGGGNAYTPLLDSDKNAASCVSLTPTAAAAISQQPTASY